MVFGLQYGYINAMENVQPDRKHTFYEFFAGGGMAHAGLGENWQCLFANDIDAKKAASYLDNWGDDHFLLADVASLTLADLPGEADLAWASFPCQDLSLAGNGKGIHAKRSGTFWPFWDLMHALETENRSPKLVVLENVYGALTSNQGKDFTVLCSALANAGYRFGAVVMDAVHFIPQSRPRLFVIAVAADLRIPELVYQNAPSPLWHPKAVQSAYGRLPVDVVERWVWWNIPAPGPRRHNFLDLIEETPSGVEWHEPAQTQRLIDLMSDVNRKKLDAVKQTGRKTIGGVYRRTRNGQQRAEVRFDNVAGCLRTPSGGSSRQTILLVEGDSVRSRLLSPREAVRLMGLPDTYKIPANYNAAYHLAGDGVVVPVVSHLAMTLLEPILASQAETDSQRKQPDAGCIEAALS